MIGLTSMNMGSRKGYRISFVSFGVPFAAMIKLRVSCMITRFVVVTCRIEIGGCGWSGLSPAL